MNNSIEDMIVESLTTTAAVPKGRRRELVVFPGINGGFEWVVYQEGHVPIAKSSRIYHSVFDATDAARSELNLNFDGKGRGEQVGFKYYLTTLSYLDDLLEDVPAVSTDTVCISNSAKDPSVVRVS